MIIIGVGLLVAGLGAEKGGLDASPAEIICMVLIITAGFSILVLRVTVRMEHCRPDAAPKAVYIARAAHSPLPCFSSTRLDAASHAMRIACGSFPRIDLYRGPNLEPPSSAVIPLTPTLYTMRPELQTLYSTLQLSLLSLLTLRRQRKKLGKVFQSVLASEPNSGAVLTKIDTIVKRIEISIPKDAQARQLQLRPQSGPATRSQKLWDFLLEVSGQVSTRNTRVLGRYPSTTLGMLAQINKQNMGLLLAHETGKEFAPDISKAADNFLLPLLGSGNEEGNHDLEARLRKKMSEFNSRWELFGFRV
jgi:hypothetical protein